MKATKKQILEHASEMYDKYSDLVWYARTKPGNIDIPGVRESITRIEESYPDDVKNLKEDESNWFPVSVDQVIKLLALNAQGIVPEGLTDEEEFEENEAEKETKGAKDELLRLDKKYSLAAGVGKKKKKKKKGSSIQDDNRSGGAVLSQTPRPQHTRTVENNIPQRANLNAKPATSSFAPRDNGPKKSDTFEGRDGNQPLKRFGNFN